MILCNNLNIFDHVSFRLFCPDIPTMDSCDLICESTNQLSEIQSFYNDKTIFLTGGTGFMGNLILDKLIR